MALIWLLIVQVQLQISCHSTTKGVGIYSTGQDRTGQHRTREDRTGRGYARQYSTVQVRVD